MSDAFGLEAVIDDARIASAPHCTTDDGLKTVILRLAGASAKSPHRRSQRVPQPVSRMSPPVDPVVVEPTKGKRGRDKGCEQHLGGEPKSVPKRSRAGASGVDNSALLKKMKQQMKERDKQIAAMQATLSEQHHLLMQQQQGFMHTASAGGAMMVGSAGGSGGAKRARAAATVPAAQRGAMTLDKREALMEQLLRLQQQRPEDVQRAAQLVGVSGDQLDLETLDDASAWTLHDFCAGRVAKKRGRPRKHAAQQAGALLSFRQRMAAAESRVVGQREAVREERARLHDEASAAAAAPTEAPSTQMLDFAATDTDGGVTPPFAPPVADTDDAITDADDDPADGDALLAQLEMDDSDPEDDWAVDF